MMKRNQLKIADIGFFKYGKSLPEEQRLEGHVPVYGSGGVGGYHSKCLVETESIIIGRKGTIGSLFLCKEPFFPIDTVFYVDEVKNGFSLKFYYYFLSQIGLNSMNSDAAVPGLNRNWVHSLEVNYPNESVQKKIAAIISTYDDLIENNLRRITLLEKIAAEMYREWFVRLRFPGYEKVKFVKGVPDGWKVLPFSEIVNINPSARLDKSEEVPFVGMEDLSLNSMFFTVKEHRKGASGSKFRNRDVLFPRITPSVENGKRGVVMTLADGQVGCGSTEFIVMREKIIGPEHIYFLTCSPEFRKHAELSMTGASGRQRVQEDCFSFFLVKTPPHDVRLQFAEVMSPHFAQIQLLSLQNESLTKSRDMLLPRLISGKLSVENLDIQFPPGMAAEMKAEAAHA